MKEKVPVGPAGGEQGPVEGVPAAPGTGLSPCSGAEEKGVPGEAMVTGLC